MKQKTLAFVAVCWLTTSAATPDIADFFAQLNTFSGDFSQTVMQDGQLVQQSVGQVILKKPLKFRWNYQTPERMQLISDGRRFYHYDVELAQVTSKPVEDVSGTAIATLLNDKKQIDEVFHIHVFDALTLERQFPNQANKWQQAASLFYELRPKANNNDDMHATRVILGLSDDRKLTVFYAEDAYGKNTFLFNNTSQNIDIPDSEFVFHAPDGVDILGE